MKDYTLIRDVNGNLVPIHDSEIYKLMDGGTLYGVDMAVFRKFLQLAAECGMTPEQFLNEVTP